MRRSGAEFIWCELHQARRPLPRCPQCKKFPCKSLTRSDIESINKDGDLVRYVAKLTRGKVKDMLFLLDNEDNLSSHKGELDSLPQKKIDETKEVYEVQFYYEQKVTWIDKAKLDKTPTKEFGAQHCIVELQDGSYQVKDIDPGIPDETINKIFPIKKAWVKQFTPVKVKVEDAPKKAPKKTA